MTNLDFNRASEDQLAKLLAMEDISIEHHAGIETASFDIQNRVLHMPIWENISKELRDMLKVHETGHAIDTPQNRWLLCIDGIAKSIYKKGYGEKHKRAVKAALNIVEDVRIDKRQKRRYPGSRRDYRIGTSELWQRDFFGLKKNNTDISKLNIIDRINLYYKGGDVEANIPFSPEEQQFLARLDQMEQFHEAVALTEELLRMAIKEAEEKGLQAPDESLGQDGSDQSQKVKGQLKNLQKDDGFSPDNEGEDISIIIEENEGDDQSQGSSHDGEGQGQGQGSGSGEEKESKMDSKSGGGNQDDAPKGDEGTNKSRSNLGGKRGGHSDGGLIIIPNIQTFEALEQSLKDLVDRNAVGYYYCTLPEAILENVVDDFPCVLQDQKNFFDNLKYKDKENKNYTNEAMRNWVQNWRNRENQTISYMVKEFEMRKAADIYSKIRQAKTGVLNMNKVHSYKYSDDIFKRNSIIPEGKNHGFVMFLDCSGSMHTQMTETMTQIMAMMLFCKRIQVPFEVYLFRDGNYYKSKNCWNVDPSKNMAAPSIFKLRNIFSSRMTPKQMEEAMMYFTHFHLVPGNPDPLGGTPLNEALIAANQIVTEFQRRTRVQIVNTIVLTDGFSKSLGFTHSRHGRGNVIFQNKKTKKNYPTNGNSVFDSNTIGITSALVRYLKESTGCTTIGMFISDTDNFYNVKRWVSFNDENKTNELMNSWNKHNFASIPGGCGYDAYFVLKPMKTFEAKKIELPETRNRNSLQKKFNEIMKAKSVNKVLLNRFIDLIVTERKKERTNHNRT